MAMLSGYSLPAQAAPMWDHVYADSDDGKLWCCFGRDTEGSQICSGSGDSSVAECLSHPIFHASPTTTTIPGVSQYAGIVYATTGVCHQAANRILHPAGILVEAARGYGISHFLYGAYGRGPWPQLVSCGSLSVGGGPSSPSGGTKQMPNDSKAARLFRKINDIYAQFRAGPSAVSEAATSEQEFRALADVNLGEGYDPEKISRVAHLQRELRDNQARLAAELDGKTITADEYVERLAALLSDTARACEEVLGSADFETLFGVPADSAADLLSSVREPATFGTR
jgi:hypothetical protein